MYVSKVLGTCACPVSGCSCTLTFTKELENLNVPIKYLKVNDKDKNKPRKKTFQTLTHPGCDNCKSYLCSCVTHCECTVFQLTHCINTHDNQSVIFIPLQYREGLIKVITFIKYQDDSQTIQKPKKKKKKTQEEETNNQETKDEKPGENIIPSNPSEFSRSYLESKEWIIQLKAHHVPKNQTNEATLYVLMEGNTSGWFEVPLKIFSKRKEVPVCPNCRNCYEKKKKQKRTTKRKFFEIAYKLQPLQLKPLPSLGLVEGVNELGRGEDPESPDEKELELLKEALVGNENTNQVQVESKNFIQDGCLEIDAFKDSSNLSFAFGLVNYNEPVQQQSFLPVCPPRVLVSKKKLYNKENEAPNS